MSTNNGKNQLCDEDFDFIWNFSYQNGYKDSWTSLPEIVGNSDNEALFNPLMEVTEKNIETYKKEYRISIKYKRYVAYGILASAAAFILAMLTFSVDILSDLTNTLWTAAAGGTILIYLYYRFVIMPTFKEYSYAPYAYKKRIIFQKIEKQNEIAQKAIKSREKIESLLENFESELKVNMAEFEKNNKVVARGIEELNKRKSNV